jgi:hypothetical protein
VRPTIQTIEFEGAALRRGFWLYVWDATLPRGKHALYVGRTGDNSSPYAQSPFVRMGQHLGFARTSNMLRTHLVRHGYEPERCRFRLVAYGPLLAEAKGRDMANHLRRRNIVGALEKALAEDLGASGYWVVNTVRCSWDLDKRLYSRVRAAFRQHFPDLRGEPAS